MPYFVKQAELSSSPGSQQQCILRQQCKKKKRLDPSKKGAKAFCTRGTTLIRLINSIRPQFSFNAGLRLRLVGSNSGRFTEAAPRRVHRCRSL